MSEIKVAAMRKCIIKNALLYILFIISFNLRSQTGENHNGHILTVRIQIRIDKY